MRAATTQDLATAAAATGGDSIERACTEAVSTLGGEPSLLLAFASGELDYAAGAEALERVSAGAPAAGMTGRGLMTADGPLDEGCVAIAFNGELRASRGRRTDASGDLRTAGREATEEALDALDADADLVLLLIDTSKGDIADTVAGAYAAAGPLVPLAGGASSGDEKLHLCCGDATSDSVIAVAVASDRAASVGNTQSCRLRGEPSIVTRSNGQRIEEIDGRPAEEVYLEQLGLTGVALDDEEFAKLSITHPLAQPELHGDVRLRHVLGRTGDGAIISGSHIPASAAIEFTELGFDDLLSSGERSVNMAAAGLGGGSPRAALVFNCAGRRRALRDGLGEEVAAITGALGSPPPPLAGLYTNGEVARLQGAKGDRNHAVVTVAFG
jgi:methyl-accepting chemotaxis protein